MGKKLKITKDQTLEAIKGSGGIITTIANRLKVSWGTARTYTEKWEQTRQAMRDEEEINIDIAEGIIIHSIQDQHDIQAAKWYLSTKGRSRGYGDSLQVSNATNEPLSITIKDGPNESEQSPAE